MNLLPKATILYDGHCPFCTQQAENLKRQIGLDLKILSFQEPGVLAKFPPLTHEACMKEIKLATQEGVLYGGAAAIFYALGLKPGLSFLWWIYQIPGFKQLADLGYQGVAKNRYRIKKRNCPEGACNLHS